jgi:hypothetical protein
VSAAAPTVGAPPATRAPVTAVSEACPLCGTPLRSDQDWCLRCGAAARTRLAASPNWRAPLLGALAVALLALGVLAAALVKLAGDSGGGRPAPTRTVTAAAAPTPTIGTPTTTTAAPGAATTTPGARSILPGGSAATGSSTTPNTLKRTSTSPMSTTRNRTAPGANTGLTPELERRLTELRRRQRGK